MPAVLLSPIGMITQVLSDQGIIGNGFKINTYVGGTVSTLQTTYTDSTGTVTNSNPITLGSNGRYQNVSVWAVPGTLIKMVITDALNNPLVGGTIDNIPLINDATSITFTQAQIGAILYPQTAAEITAAITPTNYFYPPLTVDRYGTNTTPGTTSMAAAFQAAINVAKKGGGGTITYGRTSPYLIDAALDCTTPVGSTNYGFTIRGEGNAIAVTSNSPYYPSIIFKHTGHGFDTTGSLGINFEDMTITTDTVTFPKTCFLLARNTNNSSQIMRFQNVRVRGSFSVALIYNYGSEDDQHTGCQYYNTAGTSAKVVYMTAWNTGAGVAAQTSTFTTILTGNTSTIDHTFFGGQYQAVSSDPAADVFYLDNVDSLKIISPWLFCENAAGNAGGRSLIYIDTTHGASNFGQLLDNTGEDSTTPCAYGVLFGNQALATPTCWKFDNCRLASTTAAIAAAGTNVTADNFQIRQVNEGSGTANGIIWPGTIQGSTIDSNPTKLVIGTSKYNVLIGQTTQWTITTRTNDYWVDTRTTKTWTPGTAGLTITGALTIRGRSIYHGPLVTVQTLFSAATSIVCAQGVTLTGLPLAATDYSADVEVTNANTGVVIGGGYVVGTTISLPAINVGAGVSVIVSATYFAA